jgi:molybdopterin-guanine dinucleotide biosynthesis protein A
LRYAVQNEGIRKIDDFTALYSVAIVEFNAQPDPFLNMNHPEDIAHAEAALIAKMPI